MNMPIGGRGKKAPYKTTHVRIPIDLKPQVKLLVQSFRNNQYNTNFLISESPSKNSSDLINLLIQAFKDNDLFISDNYRSNKLSKIDINLEEAIKIANELLVKSNNVQYVVVNLLNALYQVKFKL